MISTETELKADVREMTGYTSQLVISEDGLDTAYRASKRHIRLEKSLGPDVDWYDTEFPERQDALFWFTCLFAKVETGELDSQDVSIGAVNPDTLLAKNNDSVTQWYRSAQRALEAIKPENTIRSAFPARPDRQYETGTYDDQTGGSSTEVDNTDI